MAAANLDHKLKPIKKRGSLVGLLYITPLFIFLFIFLFYPFMESLHLSFYKTKIFGEESLSFEYTGFKNYFEALGSWHFWSAFSISLYISVLSVVIQFLLAFGVALVANENFKGRNIFIVSLVVPWVIAPSVNALLWKWMLNFDYGVINSTLYRLGLISDYLNWLGTPFLALNTIVFVLSWSATPFAVMMLLAGLESIPQELYEAAKVDGANVWKRFRHVTIPSLKLTIFITIFSIWLDAFMRFGEIYVLTAGGPGVTTTSAPLYVFLHGLQYLKFGYATASAWLFSLPLLIVSMHYIWLVSKR